MSSTYFKCKIDEEKTSKAIDDRLNKEEPSIIVEPTYQIRWSPDNSLISVTAPDGQQSLDVSNKNRYLINILMKPFSSNAIGDEVFLKLTKEKCEEVMDRILTIIEQNQPSISLPKVGADSLTDSETLSSHNSQRSMDTISTTNSVTNDFKKQIEAISGEKQDEDNSHQLR